MAGGEQGWGLMEGVGVPLLPLTEPEVAPVVPRPIGAHGVIGDMGTAALVADDGAVSFLCWPSFDSPSVFAALLDPAKGGVWTLAPVLDVARGRQMYVPDTNVLLTRWLTPNGAAEVADFMPFPEPGGRPRLVRRARAMYGRVRFSLRCAPRLDYARTRTRAEEDANGVVFRAEGAAALRLVGSVELRMDGSDAVADFTLGAGEVADFILLDADARPSVPSDAETLFHACIAHWRSWAARSTYKGRWREAVTRSALALKLLSSGEHGSIAAAVTFGLPETPGGVRNWDYRATWIRDASFTQTVWKRARAVTLVKSTNGSARRCAGEPRKRLYGKHRFDVATSGDRAGLPGETGTHALFRPPPRPSARRSRQY